VHMNRSIWTAAKIAVFLGLVGTFAWWFGLV
jgi:hypothetical protein